MNATPATIGSATVVWDYGDAVAEYAALRHRVARFDLGAAGILEVTGPGAFDLLQTALARDIEFVTPEQCLTSLVLNPAGDVVDLVTIYLVEEGFWVESAFGRTTMLATHLASLRAEGHGGDAVLTDRGADLGIVLLEGPAAARLVESCIEEELGSIPFLGVAAVSWRSTPLTVARSGFTGEFGYKLVAAPADLRTLWTALAEAEPAGFDALECAMLEVRQPLPHRELATGVTALQAGYNWLIDITKDDFCGRVAVVKEFEAGLTSRAIGWSAPAGCLARPGAPVTIGGERVGSVVFARPSYGRGDVLGLALIDADLAAAGVNLTVECAEGPVAARTLAAPYVYPTSWTTRDTAAGFD